MALDRLKLRQQTGIAAAGAALMLGVFYVMPVKAAEDTNTLNSFLGFFGMQFDKEPEAIDYRARAPLVIPPKTDLPPPRHAEARRPADWPTDPDVYERRKAQADSHRPAPQITPNTRAELTKEQLMAGRNDSVTVDDSKSDGCGAMGGAATCLGSPWQYVTEKMGLAKKEDDSVVLSHEEPPRKYLTEPPPGYRVPTGSVTAAPEHIKAEPDAGDAQAYSRREQTHKNSVDDN